MKNLSELVKENQAKNLYRFEATVKLVGSVEAMSEGDAGEAADAVINKVEAAIMGLDDDVVEMKGHQIDNISLNTEGPEIKNENALNTDTDDEHQKTLAVELIHKIKETYNQHTKNLTPEWKKWATKTIQGFFQEL